MLQMDSNIALKRQVCGIMYNEYEKFYFLSHITEQDKYEFFFWLQQNLTMKTVKEGDYLFKKGEKI